MADKGMFIEVPWTSQPQELVGIEDLLGYPIFTILGNSITDSNRLTGSLAGTAKLSPNRYGLGVDSTVTAGDRLSFPYSPGRDLSADVPTTILLQFENNVWATGGLTNHIAGQSDSSSSTGHYEFSLTDNVLSLTYRRNSGSDITIAFGTLPAGIVTILLCRESSAINGWRSYVNGVAFGYVNSNGYVTGPFQGGGTNAFSIGSVASLGTRGLKGNFLLFHAAIGKLIPASLGISITQSPASAWQIFKPRKVYLKTAYYRYEQAPSVSRGDISMFVERPSNNSIIDTSHKYGAFVEFAVMPTGTYLKGKSNQLVGKVSPANVSRDAGGDYLSGDWSMSLPTRNFDLDKPWTLFCTLRLRNRGGTTELLICSDQADAASGNYLKITLPDYIPDYARFYVTIQRNWTGLYATTANPSMYSNTWFPFFVTSDPGGNITLYTPLMPGWSYPLPAIAPFNTASVTIAGTSFSDMRNMILFNKVLPASAMQELYANPQQIFKLRTAALAYSPKTPWTVKQSKLRGATVANVPASAVVLGMGKRFRTTQPQGLPLIYYGNPITKAISFVTHKNHHIELVNALAGTYTYTNGTNCQIATRAGVGLSVGGASQELFSSSAYGNGDSTSMIFGMPSATPGSSSVAIMQEGSLGSVFFDCAGDQNDNIVPGQLCLRILQTGVNRSAIMASGVIDGSLSTYIIRKRGLTGQAFKNGLPVTTTLSGDLTATPVSASDTSRVYGHASNSAFGFNGFLLLLVIWKRALSDMEILSISQNPWQIFQSDTNPIWGAS